MRMSFVALLVAIALAAAPGMSTSTRADGTVLPHKLADLLSAFADGDDARAALDEARGGSSADVESLRRIARSERALALQAAELAELMKTAPPTSHEPLREMARSGWRTDKPAGALSADPRVKDARSRALAVEKDLEVLLHQAINDTELSAR